jgi:hypothetical protein
MYCVVSNMVVHLFCWGSKLKVGTTYNVMTCPIRLLEEREDSF